ncbi:hypothetical protein BX667DRAFT_474200 [Coemansia mojavensis]|nr:hypothetical protein BX667DRAFT_474200 [Coemansia mojavensis]
MEEIVAKVEQAICSTIYRVTKSGAWKPPRTHSSKLVAKTADKLNHFAYKTHLNNLAKLRYVIPRSPPTFGSVIAPIARDENKRLECLFTFKLLAKVSPDKETRRSASKFALKLQQLYISKAPSEQLDRLVKQITNNPIQMNMLEEDDRKYIELGRLTDKMCGDHLHGPKREKCAKHFFYLVEKEIEFMENIQNDKSIALFSKEELAGLPDDFYLYRRTTFVNGQAKYAVAATQADYDLIMQYASLESTRERMFRVYNTRCPGNVKLAQKIVDIRNDLAKFVGYHAYSELAIETHMAKTPRNVFVLLEELRKKLTPIARAELKELQKLKQADSKASNPSEIFEWDRVYYQHKHLMETLGSVDIREYFPLPQVLRGMFTIYEKMLGVRVVKEESANAWHPDVELYTVREANSNEHVGSIFLDLYERDGKTALNAMHKIKPGYKSEDGTFVTSKVAITTSFSQPVAQKPTLLKHRDLQMLIHELGHAFHEICARSKWSALQGTAASSDYSEAISQMMENWVWETSVLRTFAFHYQTGDPMPEDMLQKLVASKMKWQGIDALHLIALSLFDLSIHDKGLRKLNVAEHYNKTLEQVSLVKRGKHHTFGAASFSHIGNASGSTFYCYIWSRVYAADMFVSRFVKGGLSNPQTGSDFRKEVLQPGYSRDLMGNLVRFLGRNPNSQAYLGMFEE